MVFQLDQDIEYQKRDYLERFGTTTDEAADTIGMRQYSHQLYTIRIFACKQTKKADGYKALNQPISCVCPMTFVSTYI